MDLTTTTALLAILAGEGLLAVELAALGRGPRAGGAGIERRAGAVSVIPLAGPLLARGRETWFGTIAGMDTFRASLAAAAGNAEISAIVLDVDSPGGTAETAAAVRAGMADRVATLDAVIAELLQGQAPRPARARAHAFTFA